MAKKEFRVNENIVLKLEEGKTNIYVGGELFHQCKYLFMINIFEREEFNEINSIDEASILLNDNLAKDLTPVDVGLSPKEEFWGHCSNIQVWCENNYNTRLLHRNLSFSLLKKLDELGDSIAHGVFKEEIAKRYNVGTEEVREYLRKENYLGLLKKEDYYSLIEGKYYNIAKELTTIVKYEGLGLDVRHGKIIGLVLTDQKAFFLGEDEQIRLYGYRLKELPELIQELQDLEKIEIIMENLESIPKWLGDFKDLKYFRIYGGLFDKLPESIGDLQKLEELDIGNAKLKILPESIGKLKMLKKISIYSTDVKDIPESVGNLENLESLYLNSNKIEELHESIGKLKRLKFLELRNNNLKTLPNSVLKLENLEVLDIRYNKNIKFPHSLGNLRAR